MVEVAAEATTRPAAHSRATRSHDRSGTKTFTVTIDEKLDTLLDDLKDSYGKTSRAEVFRLAIALLKIAADAKRDDQKLTISDQQDKLLKEIVLPSRGGTNMCCGGHVAMNMGAAVSKRRARRVQLVRP